jgi:predicted RNA methylase
MEETNVKSPSRRRTLSSLHLYLISLLALTCQPGNVEGQAREFYSSALNQSIIVLDGVFAPIEAEKQVLPYMNEHEHLFDNKTVLDIGTGSGIIGLYAAQLGAKKVVATDISELALACTQLNAKKLGLDFIIETRLVPSTDISAFSVIEAEESFDVIISNPPYTLDLDAPFNSKIIDRGDLGFSIVRGLKSHLNAGGTAILLYSTFFYHEVIAKFARHLNYEVEHFSPDYWTPWEQDVLFNSYLERILRREKLHPNAFEFNWLEDKRSAIRNQFKLYSVSEIPKYLGLIIIRRD